MSIYLVSDYKQRPDYSEQTIDIHSYPALYILLLKAAQSSGLWENKSTGEQDDRTAFSTLIIEEIITLGL